MTTFYEVPLTPAPQRFRITLGETRLRLRFTWCPDGPCWLLDIDSDIGGKLIYGIPLLTGADLLEQFQEFELGPLMQLYTFTDHDRDAIPTFENLGKTSHLIATLP